ncbi:GNAT family N-acetyltransferase [Couchioplanes caeruleus]|uniref:GNAT family N-acetyltransferase n=1 Tax=Couchioplanes caeruleus TaxID=56438 RepID=UPI0020BFD15D|nr:GNAT family N-acetyltransferase [Couchioplanes caeruleus]UQU61626.1 GNAT family N-acetyltransferase [Couchioplanes caeruleus]
MPLHLRPLTGRAEVDLFNQLPYVLNHEIAKDLDDGRRHLPWLWVAVDSGRLVARAGFWAPPGQAVPMFLDVFDVAPGHRDDGVRLLTEALAHVPRPEEYTRFVPPGWRDDPGTRREVEDRIAALERTGAKLFVERLRLQWQPGTPVPEPSGRLTFRPVTGPQELIALMADVTDGTLDAHSRADLSRMSAAESARRQYDEELSRYTSPREWWRIGCLPDGRPAGFVLPAHNGYNPIIAYIAVVPAQRGRGYVDELLAEGTRVLAGEGVPRIRAATDLGNVPMARAFARAGYEVIERQLDMVWPS